MTRWLRCPTDHAAGDPAGLVCRATHHYDPDRAAQIIVALISEGRCPACPTVPLDRATIVLYGRSTPVGRCPCCRAAWRADPDGWTCDDRGDLIDDEISAQAAVAAHIGAVSRPGIGVVAALDALREHEPTSARDDQRRREDP